jgi:outer membrane protein OmpA-like peptidoglycan-associated protein
MTHYQKLCSLMIVTAMNLPNFAQAQKLSTPVTRPNKVAKLIKNVVISNEQTINTRQLEFSPAFFEDGIVFISSQKPLSKEKAFDERIESGTMSIFLARRDENGQLGKPEAFANSLVSSLHEGPLTFDKTAENIFFSRNNSENNGRKAKYTEGVSRLKIYTAQRQGEANWGLPTELSFNENNSDACHPSISMEGDKLYFSSNRAGGYGGMDLYVSEKTSTGTWGKPKNLGAKINTAKNEVFPFIHADGTLFYSSNGLPGSKSLDIFYAKWEAADFSNTTNNKQKSGFSTPIALGDLFNSDKDDFGFIIDLDMKNGYLTSNRVGGIGNDDIYSFSINNGTLFDNEEEKKAYVLANKASKKPSKTKPPVNAKPKNPVNANTTTTENLSTNNPNNNDQKATDESITLIVIDRETGKPIPKANAAYLNLDNVSVLDIMAGNTQNKQTPFIKPDGSFALELVAAKMLNQQTNVGGKTEFESDKEDNYVISVSKEGYETEQIRITKGDTRDEIVVLLNRPSSKFVIKEGASFKLKNVYYNYNDASIRPDAAKDLNALLAMMRKYPDLEVELGSHTDARGTTEYNVDLSQRRADNAVQYLVNRGINARRIVAKGYGESRLRNHCGSGVPCSEEEHKINRRTEVKITKSGKMEGQITTDFFTPETEN